MGDILAWIEAHPWLEGWPQLIGVATAIVLAIFLPKARLRRFVGLVQKKEPRTRSFSTDPVRIIKAVAVLVALGWMIEFTVTHPAEAQGILIGVAAAVLVVGGLLARQWWVSRR
jgi:hypothetical protein